jgi:uncharacterized membrane protein YgcG
LKHDWVELVSIVKEKDGTERITTSPIDETRLFDWIRNTQRAVVTPKQYRDALRRMCLDFGAGYRKSQLRDDVREHLAKRIHELGRKNWACARAVNRRGPAKKAKLQAEVSSSASPSSSSSSSTSASSSSASASTASPVSMASGGPSSHLSSSSFASSSSASTAAGGSPDRLLKSAAASSSSPVAGIAASGVTPASPLTGVSVNSFPRRSVVGPLLHPNGRPIANPALTGVSAVVLPPNYFQQQQQQQQQQPQPPREQPHQASPPSAGPSPVPQQQLPQQQAAAPPLFQVVQQPNGHFIQMPLVQVMSNSGQHMYVPQQQPFNGTQFNNPMLPQPQQQQQQSGSPPLPTALPTTSAAMADYRTMFANLAQNTQASPLSSTTGTASPVTSMMMPQQAHQQLFPQQAMAHSLSSYQPQQQQPMYFQPQAHFQAQQTPLSQHMNFAHYHQQRQQQQQQQQQHLPHVLQHHPLPGQPQQHQGRLQTQQQQHQSHTFPLTRRPLAQSSDNTTSAAAGAATAAKPHHHHKTKKHHHHGGGSGSSGDSDSSSSSNGASSESDGQSQPPCEGKGTDSHRHGPSANNAAKTAKPQYIVQSTGPVAS